MPIIFKNIQNIKSIIAKGRVKLSCPIPTCWSNSESNKIQTIPKNHAKDNNTLLHKSSDAMENKNKIIKIIKPNNFIMTFGLTCPLLFIYHHKYMKGGKAYLSLSSYISNLALSEVDNRGGANSWEKRKI